MSDRVDEQTQQTCSSADESVDVQNMSHSQRWQHWMSKYNFTWSDEYDLGTLLDSDGHSMMTGYVSLCRKRAAEVSGKSRTALRPHQGMLRMEMFMLLSWHYNLMTEQQRLQCENSAWYDMVRGDGNSTVERAEMHAFAIHHAMRGDTFMEMLTTSMCADLVNKVEDDDIERAMDGTLESDGDKIDITIDEKTFLERFSRLEPLFPKWLVAYVMFAKVDTSDMSIVDLTRLKVVETLDVQPLQCTLADVSAALRGISVMHNFKTVASRNGVTEAMTNTARGSSMFERLGVRNAVDMEEGVYEEGTRDRILRFQESMAQLYDYIVAETPPRPTKEQYDGYPSVKRCEMRLAVMLRAAKQEAAKKAGEEKSRTTIEALYNVFKHELVRIEEEKKKQKQGEDYDDSKVSALSKKTLYERLKLISPEVAIIWLHCSFAASSTIVDFWWALEGAQALVKMTRPLENANNNADKPPAPATSSAK